MPEIKTITAARGAESLVLANLPENIVLHITTSDREMAQTAESLRFFAPLRKVIELPAWDTLPYDRASPNPQIISKRIEALHAIANLGSMPATIITTVNAALQKLPLPDIFKTHSLYAKKGSSANREDILKFLEKNGYARVSKVMEASEYAVRGSILDIYPSGAESAVRIDFFGDEVESIKEFEVLSQISGSPLNEIKLLPASEIIFDENVIEKFKSGYRKTFGAVVKENLFYEAISAGVKYSGYENYLPLFYDRLATIFDYLPHAYVTHNHLVEAAVKDRAELTADYYDARKSAGQNPLKPEYLYLAELPQPAAVIATLGGKPEYAKLKADYKLQNLAVTLNALQKPAYIACFSQGSLSHIQQLLKNQDISSEQINSWQLFKGKTVKLFIAPIEEGFESDDFVIISEQDIFGDRFIRTVKKKKSAEKFFEEAGAYQPDDLVVHEKHGIGKFAGLETLEVSGNKHDMVKLLYEGGDRLFVPVENLDIISRYGTADEGTRLDKLGGLGWQERTSKLKERIKLAAHELLKIAAQRALRQAPKFTPETGIYDEFIARFPYTETDDQLRSIEEVFADLASGKPMDRLICGDVGFGKTEVALRAAFLVAATGAQVALICPTTLLARQHYATFSKRFEGLPFTVRQLSRMVSSKDADETRKGLSGGSVDIVIGTHALLAEGMDFKNLGIVIIDEEQHFGVKQKERLKKLRAEVHVLALSATPIPRSLQMSLSGVRDLSIIATPPVDRLAVRGFVSAFDEITIREAILREKNRNGRTFYVAPRIADLEELAPKLAKLVPEAKFRIAHGGLTPAELDKAMNDFYDGAFDVLLSTAIVESGLDIPSANTLIVHRADMFGLSQLYQLRGRVGRGKTRAYAYFTTLPQRKLTDNAYRRLEVIQNLDSLGAGFSVASHDMDIRGFGNLLGDEQSGQIKEVGVELYQKMLNEAVIKATAERQHTKPESSDFTPDINIGASILIPDYYVADLDLRMSLYKRAAALKSVDEIDAFRVEITDRFGKPPPEVLQLLDVIDLKVMCRKFCIERLDVGPKAIVMQLHKSASMDTAKLMAHISKNATRIKLRPDNKLVFTKTESEDFATNVLEVKKAMEELTNISAPVC